MSTYIESLNTLTRQYNDAIRALIASYDMETSQSVLNLGSSRLRRQYSQKYDVLKGEYMRKRRQLFNDYKLANPEWFRWRKSGDGLSSSAFFWQWYAVELTCLLTKALLLPVP